MTTPPPVRRNDPVSTQPPVNNRVGSRARQVTERTTRAEFEIVYRGDYHVDRIFLCFGRPTYDVGWKLHVVKPALTVLDPDLPNKYLHLLSYLRTHKIPHKLIRSLGDIEEMERDKKQVGKFITIYPEDSYEMKRLSDLIETKFSRNKDEDRRTAPGDLVVGSKRNQGARWGGLTGPYTVDSENNLINDGRTRSHPQWIKNPFDPESRGEEGWIKFDENPQLKDQLAARSGEVTRIRSIQSLD